jgi:hypothetical protein
MRSIRAVRGRPLATADEITARSAPTVGPKADLEERAL